jgi:hypothetical protein
MAIYPGASVRLIDTRYLSGAGMAVYNRENLHTQAGNGSLYNFFNASGRASSHFWVAKSGLVEQYVDTALQAEADLDGNDATISVETEGTSEPWTDAQVNAIIALSQWIIGHHGMTMALATSSKTDSSSRGLSWHRLGIDGNFPALPSRYAGRQQRGGGMHYSSSFGKTCPTEARIDQIFDRVWPAVSGGVTPPNPQPPNPNPTPPGHIAVDGFWGSATTRRLQEVLGMQYVDGEVWYQYKPNAQPAFTTGWVYNYAAGKGSPVIAEMQRRMGIAADGVWGVQSTNALQLRYYPGYPPDGFLAGPSNTVKRMQEALNRGEF